MNKYQEAINFIEKQLTKELYGTEQYFRKVHASVDSLKELVEKETPEPPEKTKTNLRGILFDTYLCPECGQMVKDEKYCPKCGQLIDWSKEE